MHATENKTNPRTRTKKKTRYLNVFTKNKPSILIYFSESLLTFKENIKNMMRTILEVVSVHCRKKKHRRLSLLSPSPHAHSALSFCRPAAPSYLFFTLSSPIIVLSVYNVCNLYLECHLRKALSRHSHTRAVGEDSGSAWRPAHLLALL